MCRMCILLNLLNIVDFEVSQRLGHRFYRSNSLMLFCSPLHLHFSTCCWLWFLRSNLQNSHLFLIGSQSKNDETCKSEWDVNYENYAFYKKRRYLPDCESTGYAEMLLIQPRRGKPGFKLKFNDEKVL